MDAHRLKLTKPTTVIVNISRGEVVDENALPRMVRASEIEGAGLDVYEYGTQVNPQLREFIQCCPVTACGVPTVEGGIEMVKKVIINIRLPDQVISSML